MSQRHHANEETDFEGGSLLPHTPMHIHFGKEDAMDESKTEKTSDLKDDKLNVALLIFLYVLQGIPLGLAGAVPYVLYARGTDSKTIAGYTFVTYPFSMKLLWAPIVDSVYSSRFGRRKSWLVPVQYGIGISMLVCSAQVDIWLSEIGQPNSHSVFYLTVCFFLMNFLAATQDIVVDGWALSMLKRENVGWASTCNSIGQTAGYFMGNVIFLAFESKEFSNYFRFTPQDYGFLTLGSFLYFWGIVFLVTTTLVAIFKKEKPDVQNDDEGVIQMYKELYQVLKLPPIRILMLIQLTVKISFAAADSLTALRLISLAVPREKLALLAVPMVPLQIMLPLLITKHLTGPRPWNIFLKAMPYRLVMGFVFMLLVMWTDHINKTFSYYPYWYFVVVLAVYMLHQVTVYCQFTSSMAFFAKISDPTIGGTYMTFLNTISNLGGVWSSTLSVWMLDSLTYKTCSSDNSPCDTVDSSKACVASGATCSMYMDGYYIESVFCLLFGLVWLHFMKSKVNYLQSLPESEWRTSVGESKEA